MEPSEIKNAKVFFTLFLKLSTKRRAQLLYELFTNNRLCVSDEQTN